MNVGNGWDAVLSEEYDAAYYKRLMLFLERAYAERVIYPAREDIFTALRLTPPEYVRAVVLGQDPYIKERQAHGLAFSVMDTMPPPSLRNIMREYADDLGREPPEGGCLIPWAERGVLLLNSVLTVEAGRSGSHAGMGWEVFTDAVVRYLGGRSRPAAFILWGAYAWRKAALISNPGHLVLRAPHPSPLSAYRGFFGSRPFSQVNEFFEKNGDKERVF